MGTAQDPDHIKELFAAFGPVTVRRMFSGAGVFADGLMIAIVIDGIIFLKADDRTIPRFEREGLKPFGYRTRQGARSIKSLWQMPERLYDDPDELSEWAGQAMEAARRAGAQKTRKPARTSKPKRR